MTQNKDIKKLQKRLDFLVPPAGYPKKKKQAKKK